MGLVHRNWSFWAMQPCAIQPCRWTIKKCREISRYNYNSLWENCGSTVRKLFGFEFSVLQSVINHKNSSNMHYENHSPDTFRAHGLYNKILKVTTLNYLITASKYITFTVILWFMATPKNIYIYRKNTNWRILDLRHSQSFHNQGNSLKNDDDSRPVVVQN